jgi:hypothetical protein
MVTSTGQAKDSDIVLRYSGGATNNDPTKALGGPRSNTIVPNDVQNNVWPDVSGPEAGSGRTQYRCLYVYNNNQSSGLMTNVILFLAQDSQSQDDNLWIGLGKSGFSLAETPIKDQVTPPVGITFTAPTSPDAALRVGALPPGASKAFWLKRIVKSNAAPVSGNYYVLRVEAEAPIPSVQFTLTKQGTVIPLSSTEKAKIESNPEENKLASLSDTFDPTDVEKTDDGIGIHEL